MIENLVNNKIEQLLAANPSIKQAKDLAFCFYLVENINRAYQTGDIMAYLELPANDMNLFEAIYANKVIFQIWDSGDLEIYGDDGLRVEIAHILKKLSL